MFQYSISTAFVYVFVWCLFPCSHFRSFFFSSFFLSFLHSLFCLFLFFFLLFISVSLSVFLLVCTNHYSMSLVILFLFLSFKINLISSVFQNIRQFAFSFQELQFYGPASLDPLNLESMVILSSLSLPIISHISSIVNIFTVTLSSHVVGEI